MDTPYFDNDDNWNRLWTEMETWRGTPYRHLTMVKGRGVDCTLFIGAAWKNCGILDQVTHDYYSRDWHMHTDEEMVLDSILRHYEDHCTPGLRLERFGPLNVDDLKRGDLLTFNYPQRQIMVSHHASVWIGTIMATRQRKIMINAIEKVGVVHSQYGTFWQNRLTNVFRLMED